MFIALLILASFYKAPFLRKGKKYKLNSYPFVSIIVPARNEEDNLETCLKSLLAQDYPNFEIIIADDRSTDKTFEIGKKFEAKDSRVKIVKVKDLPKGWTGKSHAIHEVINLTKGELLLFIDADTDHDQSCVTASIAFLLEKNLDCLSAEPYFEWKNFLQELLFSVFVLTTACLFPIVIVNKKGSKITLSNGQYILIKKDVYMAIGGHETIKGEILEDLALADSVKKNGYYYNLVVGADLITVKMYKDMASFWQGWSRILFLALDKNVFFALVLYLLATVISIFPFLILIYILISMASGLPPIHLISILGLVEISLIIVSISFANYFFKISPLYSLLHPFAILGGMAVMGNSIWQALHKKEIEWKDTVYKIDSRP